MLRAGYDFLVLYYVCKMKCFFFLHFCLRYDMEKGGLWWEDAVRAALQSMCDVLEASAPMPCMSKDHVKVLEESLQVVKTLERFVFDLHTNACNQKFGGLLPAAYVAAELIVNGMQDDGVGELIERDWGDRDYFHTTILKHLCVLCLLDKHCENAVSQVRAAGWLSLGHPRATVAGQFRPLDRILQDMETTAISFKRCFQFFGKVSDVVEAMVLTLLEDSFLPDVIQPWDMMETLRGWRAYCFVHSIGKDCFWPALFSILTHRSTPVYRVGASFAVVALLFGACDYANVYNLFRASPSLAMTLCVMYASLPVGILEKRVFTTVKKVHYETVLANFESALGYVLRMQGWFDNLRYCMDSHGQRFCVDPPSTYGLGLLAECYFITSVAKLYLRGVLDCRDLPGCRHIASMWTQAAACTHFVVVLAQKPISWCAHGLNRSEEIVRRVYGDLLDEVVDAEIQQFLIRQSVQRGTIAHSFFISNDAQFMLIQRQWARWSRLRRTWLGAVCRCALSCLFMPGGMPHHHARRQRIVHLYST